MSFVSPARFCLAGLLVGTWLVGRAAAQTAPDPRLDPLASLDATISAAETSLHAGELQIAESRYRSALLEGWMIAGALDVAAGRLPQARDAFRHASRSAVDADAAFQSLAMVHLQMGEAAEAVTILTKLAGRDPTDVQTRRLLAQAMLANDQPQEAVQALEETHAMAPDDPELAFLLGAAYLQVKNVPASERLFARVAAARPIPHTYVLIGRTYRDFGLYDRARAALETALKKDPRTRRAHYYLGTVAVMAEGILRLDDAIREFREELKLSPGDPMTNLRLGVALVEAKRHAEALPVLEIASRAEFAPADAFHYLGRCQLALERPADAVTSLRRALGLSQAPPIDEDRIGNIQYQLALALRRTGATSEAAIHFEEAERASARRADADRERLRRYLADTPDPEGASAPLVTPIESPFSAVTAARRLDVERRVKTALARACLNLGVMHAQAQRFARAAEFFAQGADVDPDFPQLQYSLGVAYFNAQQYEKATVPLQRAFTADPANADVRRMLALASLNAGTYDKAVELLAADPRRGSDPSLQYAYGVALVRSGHAADAQAIFSRLLADHGNTAELQVVLGQANAQQGDYDAVIRSLQRALQLKPDVAEANATLGTIYLQQGRLTEAASALKAALVAHPDDFRARHTLATVLDLDGQPDEALALLRALLRAKPDYADARYLLGKILLAQGAALEAVEQLEAAVHLQPDEPQSHYQLAQAYRKLDRMELADRHFEIYRRLKDKRRTP
jgi:tetratricopeptide (TPR) repeat protein